MRAKMSREDRAKQFMPFDALKGLSEELRKKEIEYEDRRELSEETLEELSEEFNNIENGDIIKMPIINLINDIINGKKEKEELLKFLIEK